MADKRFEWESTYGFTARNVTPNEDLAATLEAIRRRVCAYGGGDYCDCKYGLKAEGQTQQFGFIQPRPITNSEQTGCPELRELIHRLLYRPETLNE